MTQQNWNPGPPAAPSRTSSNAVWWVVLGVAVAVFIGFLAWLLLRPTGSPTVPPTTPGQQTTSAVTTDPPPSPSPSEPSGSGVDYGALPPANLGSLRSLANGVLPDTIAGHTATNKKDDVGGFYADYRDEAKFTGFNAAITVGPFGYKAAVDGLESPKHVGNATCGMNGSLVVCVMAGESETLEVGSVAPELTMEQIADFTQQIYDAN